MVIEEREPGDAELGTLLDAAYAELVARYGPQGRSQVRQGARFLVAVVDGLAVGCGAVQQLDAVTGELKRMYVIPAHRGRGVATALLGALEELALAMGHRRLRLATGLRQPEAIALYERCAYILTEPYGSYADAPLTRCYAKALAP
ncbi:GNAT family N-acetyltransferase [Nonomuraea wenchangensis]